MTRADSGKITDTEDLAHSKRIGAGQLFKTREASLDKRRLSLKRNRQTTTAESDKNTDMVHLAHIIPYTGFVLEIQYKSIILEDSRPIFWTCQGDL